MLNPKYPTAGVQTETIPSDTQCSFCGRLPDFAKNTPTQINEYEATSELEHYPAHIIEDRPVELTTVYRHLTR